MRPELKVILLAIGNEVDAVKPRLHHERRRSAEANRALLMDTNRLTERYRLCRLVTNSVLIYNVQQEVKSTIACTFSCALGPLIPTKTSTCPCGVSTIKWATASACGMRDSLPSEFRTTSVFMSQ